MSDPPQAAAPSEPAPPGRARHRRLARRTALVSGLTLISRVLGYVREVVSAALFGDRSGVYDAFITAWRVPNLFRRFLGEGALSTSFQTALTAVDADHGEEAGRTLFLSTLRVLLGLLVGLCLVVMALVALAPDRMPVTGWAWLGKDPAEVRELTLRVMPFVVFVCVAALTTGALHVRGFFAAPSIAPAAMNVVWIGALFVVAARFGWSADVPVEGLSADPVARGVAGELRHLEMVRTLAWGVLLAGTVQLAVQWPALRAAGFLGRGRPAPLPAGAPRPGDVLRRAAPLALGAAVYQINVMVDGLMAEGLLSDGGPTLHYFANRVQQFPLALIAIAATSAVFPALQQLGHERDLASLRRLHDRTHIAVAAVALPAAAGLFALSTPVVQVSFERGAFGAEGVQRTADALRVLCIAILPAGATGLVARTYYAMGDYVTPVKVSVAMLALNAGLNAWFLVGLGMDVDGLAAATTITSALNVVLLLPGLTRTLGLPRSEVRVLPRFGRILAASAVCAVVAGTTEVTLDGPCGRTVALFAAIGAGAAAYAAVAQWIGVDEVRALVAKVRARFSR
ncbi:MAG: murein biosynthesis integral membrane protein MurJ [Planctomycetota bacterium]